MQWSPEVSHAESARCEFSELFFVLNDDTQLLNIDVDNKVNKIRNTIIIFDLLFSNLIIVIYLTFRI